MRTKLIDLIWTELPDDILMVNILPFLKPEVKMLLNKTYYHQYHNLIKKNIPSNYYESYVRDMLRCDYTFVVSYILRENMDKWLKWHNYRYKSMIYKNFIYFMRQYCIDNNAVKCINLINLELKNKGLSKKNINIITGRNIRWTN
jgi:hypothetical protein